MIGGAMIGGDVAMESAMISGCSTAICRADALRAGCVRVDDITDASATCATSSSTGSVTARVLSLLLSASRTLFVRVWMLTEGAETANKGCSVAYRGI